MPCLLFIAQWVLSETVNLRWRGCWDSTVTVHLYGPRAVQVQFITAVCVTWRPVIVTRNVGRIKGGISVLHPGFGCISTHIVQWQCFVPGFVKLAFSVWYKTDSETCVKEGVVLLGVQCSGGTVCFGTHILTCRTLWHSLHYHNCKHSCFTALWLHVLLFRKEK
jgi:hypothetical protein